MITRRQCIMGRAALDWSRKDLADHTDGISEATIRSFEKPWKAGHKPTERTLSEIVKAFTKAGVVFDLTKGRGPGARLRLPTKDDF